VRGALRTQLAQPNVQFVSDQSYNELFTMHGSTMSSRRWRSPWRCTWAPDGIVAYTKICPHAGCAISLYRYLTYAPTSAEPAFTCPCDYSTFLPGQGGRLIFGPAGRSLPQLPLMVDAQGHVRAAGPFHEDIGPSWWNIHRGES
jgi:Rieske Fe-S protein